MRCAKQYCFTGLLLHPPETERKHPVGEMNRNTWFKLRNLRFRVRQILGKNTNSSWYRKIHTFLIGSPLTLCLIPTVNALEVNPNLLDEHDEIMKLIDKFKNIPPFLIKKPNIIALKRFWYSSLRIFHLNMMLIWIWSMNTANGLIFYTLVVKIPDVDDYAMSSFSRIPV